MMEFSIRRRDPQAESRILQRYWGMVSKPTNNQGVIALMEMTQAHGRNGLLRTEVRLSSDAVDVEGNYRLDDTGHQRKGKG